MSEEGAVRPALFAVLFLIAGVSCAAPYPCPPSIGASLVGCTFKSVGGTTTFTANVSAQIIGSSQAGSSVGLNMSLDALPCNINSGLQFAITNPVDSALNVNDSCTFDVTSTRPVELLAVAPFYNATPSYIALVATSVAFVPDFHLAVSTLGSGTVTSSEGSINCGAICSGSYSPATMITLSANAAAGWVFSGWNGDCSGFETTCILRMSQTRNVTANFMIENAPPVVEFYNAVMDHYFITADINEAATLDSGGAGPGWSRTGLSFKPGGDTPVCRFYGSVTPGPNSHFYSAIADECNFLKLLATTTPAGQPRWNFEGYAFATSLPANGLCPVRTVPVYRAYNNGFLLGKDSNHRITSNADAIQQVVARGWKYEGIVMCAPQ